MLPLLIAASAFASVLLLVVSLSSPAHPAVQARLRSLRKSAERGPADDLALPFQRRVLQPTLLGVGTWLARFLPPALLAGLRQALTMAGSPLSPNAFLTLCALSATLPALLVLVVLAAAGAVASPAGVLTVLVLTIAGAAFPLLWLRGRLRYRQQLILKSLPNALDLVTTIVEAGLGLDAALARVAERAKGPFAQELGRTLREIAMGRLRREALADLGKRSGVRDLATFISAVIQAEQLGVSIAQVLRVQAEQMRTRRRQRAEQAAHRAPIYLLFPLVLCIFPAFMIVVLGPGVIRIAEALTR